MLSFDPAVFAHPLTKHDEVRLGLLNKKGTKETDLVYLPLLLRLPGERRSEEAEGSSADERASVHYSMT
jgi:hypothetical protein